MLRGLMLSLLLVSVLAAALVVEAVWGYALAAVVALLVLGVFVTGAPWLDDHARRTGHGRRSVGRD